MKIMELTDDQKAKAKRLGEFKKSNDLIRKAKYDLSILGLKTMAYIFSMVKQNDPVGTWYQFEIRDYCRYLGIYYDSGKNYKAIKKDIQDIRDTSFWITKEDGKDYLIGWIYDVHMSKKDGTIEVKLHPDIEEYIKNLDSNYTKIDLISTLPMSSKYSFRIYELLKSYIYQGKKSYTFDLDKLKISLGCADHYQNYKDFRHKVLEIATEEINTYTPYNISVETITKGRKVVSLVFNVNEKSDTKEMLGVNAAIRQKLNKSAIGSMKVDAEVKGQLRFDEMGNITEE